MLLVLALLVHVDGEPYGLRLDSLATQLSSRSPAEAASMPPENPWLLAVVTVSLACALEASTSQIDNLFLPIYFQALLLGGTAISVTRHPSL